MGILFWIILMTGIVGLISLVGVFSLWIKDKLLKEIIFLLVAFSAGALISGAFFHLLAESLERLSTLISFSIFMGGFILFFIIEKYLHWHHCHEKNCKCHPVSQLILIGDGVHNFIDGLIIASSFYININFGIITTFLIILHEIPQELGNFGVLVYSGFSKTKALFWNFLSQLTAIIGGIVGFFLANSVENITPFMLSFAAGGFLYISASDLIPELHKEKKGKKSLISFIVFLFGVLLMVATKVLINN